MRENHDGPALVTLEGVSRAYPGGESARPVLDRVSFRVRESEFIALKGRSGSGKSTLLNLIAGIDLPDAGEIHIRDECINHLDEDRRTLLRRRHIGFVFQHFNLLPTLTVLENVVFPLALNRGAAADNIDRARRLLAEFSLADRAERFPDTLSGGEQQRVAITRAIAHRPAIVLADEPTGNLDEETEKEVLEILGRLPETRGVTLLCATHSPEIAARADRQLRLEHGAVTE